MCRKWGLSFVTWLSLVIFFSLFCLFCYAIYLAYKLTGYERTQGIILHSAMHVQKTSRGPVEISWTGYALQENVRYQYSVDGISYLGASINRIKLSKANVLSPLELAALKRADGKELHPNYRLGAIVDVWYDPVRPALAVLDNTVDWGLIGLLASFLMVVAAPTILFSHHDLVVRRKKV